VYAIHPTDPYSATTSSFVGIADDI